MRAGWIPAVVLLAACSNDDNNGPGVTPESPEALSSTSLDGAIALVWTDNPFENDPDIFGNYRVYSTSFDIDASENQCGSDWLVEGTTVAPEFLVGALANGVPRCFSVTAVSVDGFESERSPLRGDTPRPDSRNVALSAAPTTPNGSGFRFWDDLNDDGSTQSGELGIVRSANAPDIDFFVDRDGSGDLFLTPVREGTGVEFYNENDPVEDLTAIDFAEDLSGEGGYRTSPIQAVPGFGYVFETDGGDGFVRYGAVRVQHVGATFLILDWAFQTDPGNPELIVRGSGAAGQGSSGTVRRPGGR
jgi:hypothetical protein